MFLSSDRTGFKSPKLQKANVIGGLREGGGILDPMSPNVTDFRIAEGKGPCKLRRHNTNTLIYQQDRKIQEIVH